MEDPSTMEDTPKWEIVVEKAGSEITDRLRVESGWLYRTVFFGSTTTSAAGHNAVAMAFVPGSGDPRSSWAKQ